MCVFFLHAILSAYNHGLSLRKNHSFLCVKVCGCNWYRKQGRLYSRITLNTVEGGHNLVIDFVVFKYGQNNQKNVFMPRAISYYMYMDHERMKLQ